MTLYDKIHRAFQTGNREHLVLYHTKTHSCAVGEKKEKKKREREINILSSRALSDTLTLHLKTHTETDFENIYLESKL